MRRRAALAGLLAAPWASAIAQDKPQPSKVGWLKIQSRDEAPGWMANFLMGLQTLGQVQNRNFVMIERHADGDATRLDRLATELVHEGVSVIVATSQPAADAAARASSIIPIVGRMTDDPTSTGLAQSLAQPGKNVTGIYSLLEEMSPKRLGLLQQAIPKLKRVAALHTPGRGATGQWIIETADAAKLLNIELHLMAVRGPGDLEDAFSGAASAGAEGLVAFRSPTIVTHYRRVIELSNQYRLPGIFDAREFADAGGLISYGPNLNEIFSRLAFHVDRILKGTAPSAIPIEQPTRFEFVINLKTARSLGIEVPSGLLASVDEAIE